MKKILFACFLCLAAMSAQGQAKTYTPEEADKLDTLARRMMTQERYQEAINVVTRHLEALKQLRGESDSAYIMQMNNLGRSYYHNNQPEEAVRVMRQCVRLMEKYRSKDYANYAFVLDNAELFLGATGQSKEAEALGRKALAAYEKVGGNDQHMASILIHLAENCSANGHHKDAVGYQLRAMAILRTLWGEHSEEYIAELPYLQLYYTAQGDTKNAERVEKRIERLQQERDEGHADLPEPTEFKTAKECQAHNDDVQTCCSYLFTHTLRASQMSQAIQYIVSWANASPDVTIEVGDSIGQLFGRTETAPFGIAYMAAVTLYCLQHNVKHIDEEGYAAACNLMVQYYEHNKEIVGLQQPLERWAQMRKDGTYDAQLRREYQEIVKVREEKAPEAEASPEDTTSSK